MADSTQNRTVLITGGTSGIGQAAALGLAEKGFNIAICGRRADRLEQTRAACMEAGNGAVLARTCDVTKEDQVIGLFAETARTFGRIDVVFNNAGMFLPAARIDNVRLEDFRMGVDVNLLGAFLVAREAFRHMVRQDPQGGRIINNGSVSAHVPRPNAVTYNACKHAITGLTKSIALEGRGLNIACSQIDIGNTATDMTKSMETGMLQADGSVRPEPTFEVRHVVDALIYMSSLPLDANVQFMTVMATEMPYIGRG